ncbi:MAG: GNAT family N-acetyltransferase [Solirubrobacteraceae bacterium]
MYLSERISLRHDLTEFACGDQTLDRWLLGSALTADAMGTARTYVWSENNVVIGYFSLCPHEVRRDELPSKLSHGAAHSIPAILLARLALDRRLHGQGLGASLLFDALTRASDAIEMAGGRLIVVDAIDEPARRFYEHHGFRAAPTRPPRLFRKASDVAAALRQR